MPNALDRDVNMVQASIGIIGGTGLYEIEGMSDIREVDVDTPFGKPSDIITVGLLEGKRIAFLPRHGKGHRLTPSEVPSRANIFALKSIGVEWVISVNSAGSLKENISPGEMVIPDQIIDRTTKRVSTFFGNGLAVHAPFADPFCPALSKVLYGACVKAGVTVHKGGTYIAMEGPLFSTRAESNLYRSWGASIIGMTVIPEAKLVREAEMCYASLALVTDYDCWHEMHASVTASDIIETMKNNVANAKKIIRLTAVSLPNTRECECPEALKTSIITAQDKIPASLKRDLSLLIGKYLPQSQV